MNFAVPFYRNFKYLNDDNLQLKIRFKPEPQKLHTFVEAYQDHRIDVRITHDQVYQAIKIIRDLKTKFPETRLVLALINGIQKDQRTVLEESGLPYYFQKIIIDIDEFHYFLNSNVTDIVIGGNLGFYVKFLSNFAKEKSISLRAIVNVCQTNSVVGSFKGFFIRPEDIDIYANYIDTFDFDDSKSPIETLYEIYTRDKKWYGKLNELIMNYKGEEDSRYILPTFAEIRCGCKRRCLYDYNHICKICDRLADLGKTLEEEHLIVEVKHENNQKTQ